MAVKRGVFAPEVWPIPFDKDKVTFPCITKAHVSSHGGKSDIVICAPKSNSNLSLERIRMIYLLRLTLINLRRFSSLVVPSMAEKK